MRPLTWILGATSNSPHPPHSSCVRMLPPCAKLQDDKLIKWVVISWVHNSIEYHSADMRRSIGFTVLTIEGVISDNEQSSRRQSGSILLGHLQYSKRDQLVKFLLILMSRLLHNCDWIQSIRGIPGTCSHHVPMISSHCLIRSLQYKFHSWCCMQDCCCLDFPWNTERKKWEKIS